VSSSSCTVGNSCTVICSSCTVNSWQYRGCSSTAASDVLPTAAAVSSATAVGLSLSAAAALRPQQQWLLHSATAAVSKVVTAKVLQEISSYRTVYFAVTLEM